ncbi:hypothetical protein QWY97_00785 [Vibrio cortegadensis]|uniref:hypothetical protein n=1 Tax=Vibrio cortegadensis TaxID=1328770 RepID=UPI0021C49ABE|nr:hypothetical protein [Vibrio cortegadensis]MDN3695890.1 hypothetical protein [Vibrio cortegadensis]
MMHKQDELDIFVKSVSRTNSAITHNENTNDPKDTLQHIFDKSGLSEYMQTPKMKSLSMNEIRSLTDDDLELLINGNGLEKGERWAILTTQDLRSELNQRYYDKGAKISEKASKRANLIAMLSLLIAILSLILTFFPAAKPLLEETLHYEALDSVPAKPESVLNEPTQAPQLETPLPTQL